MIKKHGRIALAAAALFALSALALVACGDDDTSNDNETTVSVSGAFARFPAGANGAVYLSIDNRGEADALLKASTGVAGMVQLHESVVTGSTTEMRQLTRIEVPRDAHVHLEPGGLHIMLMDVGQVPDVGDTISVELTFEHAGAITIEVEVVALGDDTHADHD